jgi:antitoxin FitA
MCATCGNVERMAKMIQIRNVPDDLHRTLKTRAAQAGMTLSDYLLAEVRYVAERPTLPEILARIRARPRVRGLRSSAPMIRRMRARA